MSHWFCLANSTSDSWCSRPFPEIRIDVLTPWICPSLFFSILRLKFPQIVLLLFAIWRFLTLTYRIPSPPFPKPRANSCILFADFFLFLRFISLTFTQGYATQIPIHTKICLFRRTFKSKHMRFLFITNIKKAVVVMSFVIIYHDIWKYFIN